MRNNYYTYLTDLSLSAGMQPVIKFLVEKGLLPEGCRDVEVYLIIETHAVKSRGSYKLGDEFIRFQFEFLKF